MNDSAYKLIGQLTVQGGKWYLRQRYGRLMMPKGVAAGIVGAGVLLVAGVATVALND